jgi:hypothetical protein
MSVLPPSSEWWVPPNHASPPSLIALKMEAVHTPETLVNSFQSTWYYNPEDSHPRTHCHESFKSHEIRWVRLVFSAWWVGIQNNLVGTSSITATHSGHCWVHCEPLILLGPFKDPWPHCWSQKLPDQGLPAVYQLWSCRAGPVICSQPVLSIDRVYGGIAPPVHIFWTWCFLRGPVHVGTTSVSSGQLTALLPLCIISSPQ